MTNRKRPISLQLACLLTLMALVIITGRTLVDLQALSKTRDAVAMSALWAQAVWCNVAGWVAIGLPLYGAALGWNIGRLAIAFWTTILVGGLVCLILYGVHAFSGWAVAILLMQIGGTVLFFIPQTNAYFRR